MMDADGGADFDKFIFNRATAVEVDLELAIFGLGASGLSMQGFEAYRLSDQADIFKSDAAAVDLKTYAGNDVVVLKGGDDRVKLGAGNDSIDAGAGHDLIATGIGDDTVYGGAGNDRIVAQGGSTKSTGGPTTIWSSPMSRREPLMLCPVSMSLPRAAPRFQP